MCSMARAASGSAGAANGGVAALAGAGVVVEVAGVSLEAGALTAATLGALVLERATLALLHAATRSNAATGTRRQT